MTGVEWETPPPKKSGNKDGIQLRALLEELAERPGQWAVYSRDYSIAGAGSLLPRALGYGYEVEVTSRRNNGSTTKRGTVYIRVLTAPDGQS